MCVCVCVCVCEREREREGECVCVRARARACVRTKERREGKYGPAFLRKCVQDIGQCRRERERESKRVGGCVCLSVYVRACVRACVWLWGVGWGACVFEETENLAGSKMWVSVSTEGSQSLLPLSIQVTPHLL